MSKKCWDNAHLLQPARKHSIRTERNCTVHAFSSSSFSGSCSGIEIQSVDWGFHTFEVSIKLMFPNVSSVPLEMPSSHCSSSSHSITGMKSYKILWKLLIMSPSRSTSYFGFALEHSSFGTSLLALWVRSEFHPHVTLLHKTNATVWTEWIGIIVMTIEIMIVMTISNDDDNTWAGT